MPNTKINLQMIFFFFWLGCLFSALDIPIVKLAIHPMAMKITFALPNRPIHNRNICIG